MTNYVCRNCGYKFKSAFEQKGKSCQYCGETNSVMKEPSADELLKDIIDE
jgi:DNA-directed RNA polymerase subunit RPC12/RpoP